MGIMIPAKCTCYGWYATMCFYLLAYTFLRMAVKHCDVAILTRAALADGKPNYEPALYVHLKTNVHASSSLIPPGSF
jgi:hypothetical protein